MGIRSREIRNNLICVGNKKVITRNKIVSIHQSKIVDIMNKIVDITSQTCFDIR